MDNEQFERLIQSIDSLTEAVRNLDGGTGDKRRVANEKIERDLFERKQLERDLKEQEYLINQQAIDAMDF